MCEELRTVLNTRKVLEKCQLGWWFCVMDSLPSWYTYKFSSANTPFDWLQLVRFFFFFNSIPLLAPAIAMPELLGKSEERLVCQGNFPKFLFLEEKIRQWPRSAVWGWGKTGASFCQWSCHSIFQAPRCGGGVRVAWLWARRHRCTSRVSQMQSTQELRLFGFWAPSVTYNLYRGPSVYWLCSLGHVRVSMTHFPHLQNRDPNSGQSSEGCKD